jgi:hypothetical protein
VRPWCDEWREWWRLVVVDERVAGIINVNNSEYNVYFLYSSMLILPSQKSVAEMKLITYYYMGHRNSNYCI